MSAWFWERTELHLKTGVSMGTGRWVQESILNTEVTPCKPDKSKQEKQRA